MVRVPVWFRHGPGLERRAQPLAVDELAFRWVEALASICVVKTVTSRGRRELFLPGAPEILRNACSSDLRVAASNARSTTSMTSTSLSG
jgi:hypothetical protein